MRKLIKTLAAAVIAFTGLSVIAPASAAPIPTGWSCAGNCGSLISDGVVTAPPVGTGYQYISSEGGLPGVGQLSVGGTVGSTLQSAAFAGTSGTALTFAFNYVTSDGSGFADYAWAKLLNLSSSTETLLFTARTKPSGDIVPGFGLPGTAPGVTLGTSSIISGGPVWSPLGGDSGRCFNIAGCGYTGWVSSSFTLPSSSNYAVLIGVTDWQDANFASGLAVAGIAVGGIDVITQAPITPPTGGSVPVPGSLLLLAVGALGLGLARFVRR
jgi:hypothetical protein